MIKIIERIAILNNSNFDYHKKYELLRDPKCYLPRYLALDSLFIFELFSFLLTLCFVFTTSSSENLFYNSFLYFSVYFLSFILINNIYLNFNPFNIKRFFILKKVKKSKSLRKSYFLERREYFKDRKEQLENKVAIDMLKKELEVLDEAIEEEELQKVAISMILNNEVENVAGMFISANSSSLSIKNTKKLKEALEITKIKTREKEKTPNPLY